MPEVIEQTETSFLEYADDNNPELNEFMCQKVEVVEQVYFNEKSLLPE